MVTTTPIPLRLDPAYVYVPQWFIDQKDETDGWRAAMSCKRRRECRDEPETEAWARGWDAGNEAMVQDDEGFGPWRDADWRDQ